MDLGLGTSIRPRRRLGRAHSVGTRDFCAAPWVGSETRRFGGKHGSALAGAVDRIGTQTDIFLLQQKIHDHYRNYIASFLRLAHSLLGQTTSAALGSEQIQSEPLSLLEPFHRQEPWRKIPSWRCASRLLSNE